MSFLCRVYILIMLFLTPTASMAIEPPAPPEHLEHSGGAVVIGIAMPFILQLDDGRTIKLAGLTLPSLSQPPSIWTLRAKEWMQNNLKGQYVHLYTNKPGSHKSEPSGRIDRYGRILAHVLIDSPSQTWVQKDLLEAGLAVVQSLKIFRQTTRTLYRFEQTARAKNAGLWQDKRYQIRDVNSIRNALYSEQIIRAEVTSAKMVRDRLYLNFARSPDDSWKTDFTVSIRKSDLRLFKAAGLDPLSWTGRTLQIRGWVRSYNGPLIEVTHPEQIEIMPTAVPGSASSP